MNFKKLMKSIFESIKAIFIIVIGISYILLIIYFFTLTITLLGERKLQTSALLLCINIILMGIFKGIIDYYITNEN